MVRIKHLAVAFTVAFVCLAFLASIVKVSGLKQNEWSVKVVYSSDVYYQGDSGSVTVSFNSNCPEKLKFTWVGIHFDWMPQDTWCPLDLSDNPVEIANQESHIFDAISFNVPSDAPVVTYSIFLVLKGQQYSASWRDISVTLDASLTIHDAYEKVYNQLYSETSNELSNTQSNNFNSPNAQSLFAQANNEFNIATSLANQGQWHDAATHLQSASNLIDQAKQSSGEQQTIDAQLAQSILLIIIAVIVIALVVGGTVFVIRRNKQLTKPNYLSNQLSGSCDACGKPIGAGYYTCSKCKIHFCFRCSTQIMKGKCLKCGEKLD